MLRGHRVVAGLVALGASASSATRLRNATLQLSVDLRDAHGTAPVIPVRFRGALVAGPRR